MNNNLLSKIRDKSAVIGILGMGYVGIPLLIRFASQNFKVIGFDIEEEKVNLLNEGKSYFKHIESSCIEDAILNGFESTSDFSRINEVDAIIICLPTPLKENNIPDLSFVINSIETIKPFLRKDQALSLESTTYPGTTEEEIKPHIESIGLKIGEDFFLIYSPEREDPGNPNFNPKNIPKIISGHTSSCLKIAEELYGSVVDEVIPVSSLRAAEMTKLLENIYRAVNIGLVNEMKIVADAMDINIHEVISGASTKPFGYTPFFPGPGLGGHCIPIDPFYLTWKAKQFNVETRFIELAGQVNTNMPKWVIKKVVEGLENHEKEISKSKILVLGLAYKKNIDDVRESPAVEIISLLSEIALTVDYHDPYINKFPKMRRYKLDKSSVELTEKNINSYDLVLLVTDHDIYDFDMLKKASKLLVDTRGRYKKPCSNIISA